MNIIDYNENKNMNNMHIDIHIDIQSSYIFILCLMRIDAYIYYLFYK